jgi:CRISPR type III-A-associated RAMP protein Csm4
MLIKLLPTAPWRIGPDSGDRDRVDRIYHSDSLYSAVSSAMVQLGLGEGWFQATAQTETPAVRFSSCFPFHGDTLYVVPPRSHWPPPPSTKVRWKGARFVPLSLIRDLFNGGTLNEESWTVDVLSECLIAHGTPGPCRVAVRSAAAIDRGGSVVAPHSSACLEFAPGAGLWFYAEIADDKWREPVLGAIRLLGDSGFGGERSRGWGHAEVSTSDDVMIEPQSGSSAWWMLSLYHPAATDSVDWQRGNYTLTTRGGRANGTGELKKLTRMIAEGSVLVAEAVPVGAACDVAPENSAHPIYRAGFALAVGVPGPGAGKAS